MSLDSVLEEAGRARSGYDLVSFKEAGLPIFAMRLRILILERKPLSPIEEHVLKAIKAELDAPASIFEFLGLPASVLTPVLVALNTAELINYSRAVADQEARVTLSSKGRNALAECSIIKPQERTIEVCFDALTKRLLVLPPEQLYRGRDMRDMERFEVPIGTSRRPEIEDIPLRDFDKVLERHASLSPEWSGTLLSIRRIERRELRYLGCTMLFYKNQSAPHDVQVGFWREDGQSLDHEVAFAEVGGPDLVGAGTLPNEIQLSSEIAEATSLLIGDSGALPASVKEVGESARPPEATVVETMQTLLCHEHPIYLRRSLLSAKQRLIIVSPWIRDAVVDFPFCASLEALLRRGVEVYIGFGINEADDAKKKSLTVKADISIKAERELLGLAGRFENFKFVNIGNTHRKSLVCDDELAIVTSFNWLSYKGDSKGRPRDERGVAFRKREHVAKLAAGELALIATGTRLGRPEQKTK